MIDLDRKIPPERSHRVILHAVVLAFSLVSTILLVESRIVFALLERNQEIFLLSAFTAGFFFSSAFTTAPAVAVLAILGQTYNPLLVSLVAATGSVLGDLIILKIIRDDLTSDLETLVGTQGKTWFRHILRARIIHLPLIILSAVIIASPLPDELGISILGMIKFKTKYFYLLSLTMNFLGILFIATLGSLI